MPEAASTPSSLPTRLLHSPAALLLMVGGLLGLTFPLAKLAGAAGVPPPVWATLISGSAAILLGLVLAVKRRALSLTLRHLRYYAVVATVSYALPNVLMFAAIPHLGSAYTAIMITLSPIFTVMLSILARLRRPSRLELAGIAIGFLGTLLVVSARGELGRQVDWLWIAVGVIVPFSLAAGNVYRTLDMPVGAHALVLAVGSNAGAALLLVTFALIAGGTGGVLDGIAALLAVPGIALLQIVASAAMIALFFQLQAVGGPVTLSQIGTVSAAVGVVAGTAFLGERYAPVVWIGIAVIAAGLSLTIRARMRR